MNTLENCANILGNFFFSILFQVELVLHCRVSFADPVAVRHALEILSELAAKDPYSVAMALGDMIIFKFFHIAMVFTVLDCTCSLIVI